MQRKVIAWLMLCVLFLQISHTGLQQTQAAESSHIKIQLMAQGGTGGTSEIYVETGGTLPAVTIPVRRGYEFQGYYERASAQGEQYYDETGAALKTGNFTGNTALYAFWKVSEYHITYANMEGAVFGTYHPEIHTYGLADRISDPTKDGYTFFGWKINDSRIASTGLVLGSMTYIADITLTAVWNKAHLVTVVNNSTDTVEISTTDLQEIFNRQVEDSAYGVTADDLNTYEVKLSMTASDQNEQAEGAEDILGIIQGEAVKFYDFSVTKSIKKTEGDQEVVSGLTELPNTVMVKITLPEELSDRSGYRVYRYHNDVPQAIPLGPVEQDALSTREYFETSENAEGRTVLTLHTSRLSTYAVIGNSKSFSGSPERLPAAAPVDVQARMLVSSVGAVYKVDITWGPMQFAYSTGTVWDPDEHRYTELRFFDWVPDLCYSAGNNEVTIANHSNADVMASFYVTNMQLQGVDMMMKQKNEDGGAAAEDMLLEKVPAERAGAPSISAFLRLSGSPTNPKFYEGLAENGEGYVKVGNIAVTISYTDSALTPKG